MTKEPQTREAGESANSAPAPPGPILPRWKIVLLMMAGLLVVSGLCLNTAAFFFSENGTAEENTLARVSLDSNGGDSSGLRTGLTADTTGASTTDLLPRPPGGVTTTRNPPSSRSSRHNPGNEHEGMLENWSPTLVKGGLSFFVGFCLGYALRSFVKITALVFGLVFLAIFGLAYVGALHVDWSWFRELYQTAMATLHEEASEFGTFVQGSFPAAGIGGLGLFTGFKKK